VKQNDGFINVKSEPGKRTTFDIYLPPYDGKIQKTLKENNAKKSDHGHETILLVEDEPMILNMIRNMLKRQGYNVLHATSPFDAIFQAKEQAEEIHLLITDVIMPEMNGRDLAEKLIPIVPGLKCLFMSGYTADVIAHHSVLDEGVHFIQKPFSLKDLTAKVRETLDK